MRRLLVIAAAIGGGTASAGPRPELAVRYAFPGIDIVESSNHFIYSHGGPPAKVDHASLVVEVRDARAHTIAVRSVAIASTCKPDIADLRTLKRRGHELFTWDTNQSIAKGAARVRTPAGKPDRHRIVVHVKELSTTAGCAFVLDVVVDRVRRKIVLPLTLEREADDPR